MKFSKEAKIGIIGVVGIAILFWGINFLKGKDFFSNDKLLFAVYDQVEGLSASRPVMVNGLKVGLIRDLELIENGSGKILVSMLISNKIQIPSDSKADIFSTDILGSKGIKIIVGTSQVLAKNRDTLQSGVTPTLTEEVSAQVAPIRAKAESLLSSMDSVLITVREVFNEQTKQNLKRSFESISNSLTSIESITTSLDTVLSTDGRMKNIFVNLESISTNLKNNNEEITRMIENFSAISDTIARSNISATLEHTRKTLEQTAGIMEKVNKGEGTLGQLANNDSLYRNLNATAADLDSLLKDLKNNPGRYVRLSFISFGGGKSKKNKE
jgi:phospholipid/cholesterol/gamma-HCH transport system substrate-binding protein